MRSFEFNYAHPVLHSASDAFTAYSLGVFLTPGVVVTRYHKTQKRSCTIVTESKHKGDGVLYAFLGTLGIASHSSSCTEEIATSSTAITATYTTSVAGISIILVRYYKFGEALGKVKLVINESASNILRLLPDATITNPVSAHLRSNVVPSLRGARSIVRGLASLVVLTSRSLAR